MKFQVVAAAMAGLALPTFAADFPLSRTLGAPKIVPNKVMVELATPGTIKRGEPDIHARFLADLERRLPKSAYKVRKQYSSQIFTGVAVDLTNVNDLETVANATGVQAVRPVMILEGPKVKLDKGALEQVKNQKKAPGQYPPNIMTGVDRIHKTGNRGKGIKIGVIDSGVDYMHPALGGGFGKGFKIAGGYDFVGDNYDPSVGTTVPDADPMDQCNGHGTHVAGILAANPGNMFNVTGVAYEATINAYRVFGCQMRTDDAIIIDALIRAYNDGNDVITLSLSDYGGWSESTLAVVANRIVKRGRVITAASGNEGEWGAFFAESPSSGPDIISVASTESTGTAPLFTISTNLNGVGPIPYFYNGGVTSMPIDAVLPIYPTSRDSSVEDDACNPLPDNTPDLSGYATLVRRGTCSFVTKIQNVLAKGGQTVIVYNNGGPFATPDMSGYDYAVLIQDADGLALLDGVVSGKNVTVSFPKDKAVNVPNTRTGGLISEMSTYGPTFEMRMKASLAAPGGGILSTYPTSMGSYMVASGTSMATPHVAGLAALILKARGKGAASDVRRLLQSTSTSIMETLAEDSRRQTLAQSGAGQANIFNALTYTTSVSPSELLLNDTAHWNGRQTIVIRNGGRKTRTYKIKHVPAGTAMALVAGTNQTAAGPIPLDDSSANVRLSSSRVTLGAGRSASILVTFNSPSNIAPSQIPIVSGHIEVATQGETLRVSYLGVPVDMRKAAIVDTSDVVVGTAFPFLLDAVGAVQAGQQNYSFVGEDYPVLTWRLVMGTARMVMDLVSPSLVLPTANGAVVIENPVPQVEEEPAPETAPVVKRGLRNSWLFGAIGTWGHGRPKPNKASSYSRIQTIGQLGAFEYLNRHNMIDEPYSQFAVMNVFANGTAVSKGDYKLLVRWLKLGGDPLRQEHYESWLSPVFSVM